MAPVIEIARASLSLQQQRECLMDATIPDNRCDNLPPWAVILTGNIRHKAIEASLNKVIDHHEILRTVFRRDQDDWQQVVLRRLNLQLTIEDLSMYPSKEAEMIARTLIRTNCLRHYDLETGPMIRASLIRLGKTRHIVVLEMQHIVSDLWSMKLVILEWAALYNDMVTQRIVDLPKPTAQYIDFTNWQRAWIDKGGLERELNFWGGHLNNMAALRLKSDNVHSDTLACDGEVASFFVPPDLCHKLRRFSSCERVTLFVTLLTGFKVLLSRYAKVTDVAVGTPMVNRPRRMFEHTVGHFANTVILRTELSMNESLRCNLWRVRDVCLDAYAHQHLPWWLVAKELGLAPNVQIMFMYHTAPIQPGHFHGLKLSNFESSGVSLFRGSRLPTRLYEQAWEVWERESGLEIVISYRSDCFEACDITPMCEDFLAVLKCLVADPLMRTSTVPLTAVS